MNEDIRQDIVIYRMGKAHQLLHDVDILVENELWNSAINRMIKAYIKIPGRYRPGILFNVSSI
jgi:hypothetical protein